GNKPAPDAAYHLQRLAKEKRHLRVARQPVPTAKQNNQQQQLPETQDNRIRTDALTHALPPLLLMRISFKYFLAQHGPYCRMKVDELGVHTHLGHVAGPWQRNVKLPDGARGRAG